MRRRKKLAGLLLGPDVWSQQVNLIILSVLNFSTEITLPAWRAQGEELRALNELMQMANLGRECLHGQDCSQP